MMSLSCKNHIGRTALGVRKPAPPAAHIVAGCGDRSGSMQSMRGAPPLQFHEQMLMLADTGKKLDVPTIFTLVTFDDRTEVPSSRSTHQTPTADLPSQSEFVRPHAASWNDVSLPEWSNDTPYVGVPCGGLPPQSSKCSPET